MQAVLWGLLLVIAADGWAAGTDATRGRAAARQSPPAALTELERVRAEATQEARRSRWLLLALNGAAVVCFLVWWRRSRPSPLAPAATHEPLRPPAMRWLMSAFVQRLLAHRESLLDNQQRAERDMAQLEERLTKIHAPLAERLKAYEKRIAELERALAARSDENRELLQAKIDLARERLQAGREQENARR